MGWGMQGGLRGGNIWVKNTCLRVTRYDPCESGTTFCSLSLMPVDGDQVQFRSKGKLYSVMIKSERCELAPESTGSALKGGR